MTPKIGITHLIYPLPLRLKIAVVGFVLSSFAITAIGVWALYRLGETQIELDACRSAAVRRATQSAVESELRRMGGAR